MHSLRAGCSIQFDEFVIITGGIKDCDNDDCTNPRVDTVSKYNISGWVEYLPSLNTARSGNGCGHYINSNDEVVNLCDCELVSFIRNAKKTANNYTDLTNKKYLLKHFYGSVGQFKLGPDSLIGLFCKRRELFYNKFNSLYKPQT